MFLWAVLIFILSCAALALAGNWVVISLERIAHFLRWKEFVVSFLLMSVVTSMPELFIGISAAGRGIAELSLGNIIGQNIVHFTLAISLCVLILGRLEIKSRLVKETSLFTVVTAILPLLLLADNRLSRNDGLILILFFLIYMVWLFSKRNHFIQVYRSIVMVPPATESFLTELKIFFSKIGIFLGSILILLTAAQGIIFSSSFFVKIFNIPLVVFGALVVGLGTALPETYFALASARHRNRWLLIGNLLGSTVISSTFVLGIVTLINPIVITNFSPYFINRLILLVAAVFFFIFSRTGQVITKREAFILFSFYIVFLILEIVRGI